MNRKEQQKRFIIWVNARDDDWWNSGNGAISIFDFNIMQEFFQEDFLNALDKVKENTVEKTINSLIDTKTCFNLKCKNCHLNIKVEKLKSNT